MHFATFLTLMLQPQEVITPGGTLLCYQELREEDGRSSGLARLEVDSDRVVSSLLMIRGGGFEAAWSAASIDGAVALAPASLDVDPWPLPKETRFPIKVKISIDGKNAGEFPFRAATVQVVDVARYSESLGTVSDKLLLASSPAVELPDLSKSQKLWGATSVVLVTTDAGGATVDRHTLEMPDWQKIHAFAEATFPALEARRASGDCPRMYQRTIID